MARKFLFSFHNRIVLFFKLVLDHHVGAVLDDARRSVAVLVHGNDGLAGLTVNERISLVISERKINKN